MRLLHFSYAALYPALLLLAPVHGQTTAPPGAATVKNSRSSLTEVLEHRALVMFHKAEEMAANRGWRTSGETPEGVTFRLIGQDALGRPLYYQTTNTNAAISTGADTLQQAPYGLAGAGLIAGLWDGGAPLPTHQEFNQTGSSRIITGEAAPLSAHATATAGTMIAGGVDGGAMGMAPEARVEAYDYFNDYAEMAPRVAASPEEIPTQLPVTNHSYGLAHGWASGNYSGSAGWHWFGLSFEPDGSGLREDLYFGRYGEDASIIDNMAYGAPYWLMFKSSGNDRNQNYGGPTDGTGMFFYWDSVADDWALTTYTLATAPFADGFDAGGFDTMIDNANAKNVIAVGSVTDAVTGGLRDPAASAMSNFSGWGPADDGRVKPDLVANGHQLRTPISTSNVSYSTSASGTSFSAPNAAGTALLLIEQAAKELDGAALRASTLKGLFLHTATDLGRPGPDYEFGWGLPDGTRAADLITVQSLDPGGFHLIEALLDDTNPDESFPLQWDGLQDLAVTICWTDPPADPLPMVLDSRTPALINDLDLRITGPDGAFSPFVLNPESPASDATTGDNVVDTIEKVIVPAGGTPGTYLATITHKGVLTNGSQWYSLVAEGQAPGGAVITPSLHAPDVITLAEGEVLELDVTALSHHLAWDVTLSCGPLPEFATFTPGPTENPTSAVLRVAPGYLDGPATATITLVAVDTATTPSQTLSNLEVHIRNTPTLAAVTATAPATVLVTFDSPMAETGPGSVLEPAAYTIQTEARAELAVLNVVAAGGNSYTLQTGPQIPDQVYELTVLNVTDTAGNPLSTEPGLGSTQFTGFESAGISDWREHQ